jgi:Zn-dependent protease
MQLKRGVRLGRPLGIPLLIHGSWLPAVLLLVVHFAYTAYAGLERPLALWLGLITALAFFLSLLAHEYGHALVARAMGIPVMDITLFVFGGVARIGREPSRPAQEAVMASAGPLVSACIGAGLLTMGAHGTAGSVVHTLALANLAVAVFNLLPGFPLDGGRLLRAWLWSKWDDPHRAALSAGRCGQIIGVLLASAGVGVYFVLHGPLEGLWLVVLGSFLFALATAARRASRVAAELARHRAGTWAKPFAGTLSPDARLSAVAARGTGPYAVSMNGRLAGIVTSSRVSTARNASLVRDVMLPWQSGMSFPAEQPLTRALERLAVDDHGVLVVVDKHGSVVGLLDHARVRMHLTPESS